MKTIIRLALSIAVLLNTLLTAQTPVHSNPPRAAIETAVQAMPAPVPDQLSGFENGIASVVNADANARDARINDLLALQHHMAAFLQYAKGSPAILDVLKDVSAQAVHDVVASQVEASRMDEQSSPGPNASGSASAVAKAGLTSLLTAAIENGAITQSLNGNTATLNGNAYGVLRFLAGANPFPYCAPNPPTNPTAPHSATKGCGARFLRDLGFSVSFDTNTGSTKTVATSPADNPPGTPATVDILAGSRRFSGASLKYVFKNPRDVRSKTFQTEWSQYYNNKRTDFQTAGSNLLAVIAPTLSPLIESDQSVALQRQYRAEIKSLVDSNQDQGAAALQTAIQTKLAEYLDAQLKLARTQNPKFDDQVKTAFAAYMRYEGTTSDLLDNITKVPVFSAEYQFERPQGQPDLTHFRLMSTLNPFGPSGTLNINAAATLYDSSSVSKQFGRWRDAQASLQLERAVAGSPANGPARLSLAGYFQYMISPGLISIDSGNFAPGTNINLGQSAALALSPTGPIWIAEAKVTFKLKNSGAEIPISVTRANRTDLIKATDTRGHIGISYDLDKLFTNK